MYTKKDNHNAAPYRTRVLIVENDPNLRADHIGNLNRWGYESVVAEGQGEALLQDAREKAQAYRCQVALVDMRLLDDYNRNDTSGLDLVSDLKPTVSIIVSGHGDRATTRNALKEKRAYDFVGKEEGPAALRQVVAEAAESFCVCRYSGSQHWHPAAARDLSGGVYEFSGTPENLKSFGEFYQEADSAQISRTLEDLFKLFGGWQLRQSILNAALYDVYLHSMSDRLTAVAQHEDVVALNGWRRDLPNTVIWTLKQREASRILGTRQALAHRNLHVDTIFVDEQGKPWLKNFTRAGDHHVLYDFITLEVDILTRLALSSDDDLHLFYEIAVAIADPSHLDQPLQPTMHVLEHPGARKALAVVSDLRQLALAQTHYTDQREYVWGLLLEAVGRIAHLSPDHPQYEKACVLSDVICGRLAHWEDESWPPRNWPAVTWVTPQMQREREVTIKYLRQQLELLNAQISGYDQPPPALLDERDATQRELQQFGENV